MLFDPHGTDDPVFDWEYAGSHYRISNVGGLMRFEQEVRGGSWYLIEPNHDTTSMMICAKQLADLLLHANATIRRLTGGDRP